MYFFKGVEMWPVSGAFTFVLGLLVIGFLAVLVLDLGRALGWLGRTLTRIFRSSAAAAPVVTLPVEERPRAEVEPRKAA